MPLEFKFFLKKSFFLILGFLTLKKIVKSTLFIKKILFLKALSHNELLKFFLCKSTTGIKMLFVKRALQAIFSCF